jgi:hypothetical protein
MSKKTIRKHVNKKCSVCPSQMDVIIYSDRSYRGGHYFGKIPLISKKEWAKANKFGTHTSMIGDWEIQVMNKDPKPYGHIEYWECQKCYWSGK